ncbi:GNAT family N-acetyltransferase, partial [Micromonospora phytophila]|nr:GNAT family N-acetyltransferase [Micromonospora phytophila]
MLDRRLHLHLASWLGQWPAGPGLHVVASHRRARPAWDGRLRPAIAVSAGASTVLSVAPERVNAVRELARRGSGRLLAG